MIASAVFYALGYLTGLAAFAWMAQRRRMATSGIFTLMSVGLLGGLLAANLTQWLTHATIGGPAGKTVLGGVAGGYLAVLLYKRVTGLRRPTGDLFAVALSAGEAVGRLGCFFGGCCYGKPTLCAWAVWQHGAARHPTQLYLSLACLAILLFLLWLDQTHPPENMLFYTQGLLYCTARFGIEFFREQHSLLGILSVAQWVCILGAVFFGWRLYRLKHREGRQALAVS
jgi:phosphatidylglycerol:prolipoprotein diacylglycerol transferase